MPGKTSKSCWLRSSRSVGPVAIYFSPSRFLAFRLVSATIKHFNSSLMPTPKDGANTNHPPTHSLTHTTEGAYTTSWHLPILSVFLSYLLLASWPRYPTSSRFKIMAMLSLKRRPFPPKNPTCRRLWHFGSIVFVFSLSATGLCHCHPPALSLSLI